MESMIKFSDYLARFLSDKGIKVVFELSGGMITHILDSISIQTDIRIVSVHHEQAAAFAADAAGRVSGVPGVALATSGPGATNLLTGIGSCYFDSVPALFITGQVNTHEIKGEKSIRQQGFQETDIVSMAKPITKACFMITSAEDGPRLLEEAYSMAISGRPGPVLIDIPMDVQRKLITVPLTLAPEKSFKQQTTIDFDLIYKALGNSTRPLIIVGRGIRAANAQHHFLSMLKKIQVPVCSSLLGLDVLPFDHELRVGFFGSYGNRWANQAIADSDLVLVLGARLDIRQTGADVDFFSQRKIIQVDCEKGEINNRVKGCIPIIADVGDFIKGFNIFLESKKEMSFPQWQNSIKENKIQMDDTKELGEISGINPNLFMHQLSHKNPTALYLADVGSHQMWAAQSLEIDQDQLFITSGGMGSMGYALPAAIGATLTLGKSCTVIVGDGCMQLNIQELQTIVRNRLPLKIVVMNNQSLGMIRQFQDSYFDSRYQSTVWGYSAPDFEKIATAYGIKAVSINDAGQCADAIHWLFSKDTLLEPMLLQVNIEKDVNVYPKIAFGRPLHEMEPSFKPQDMEGT